MWSIVNPNMFSYGFAEKSTAGGPELVGEKKEEIISEEEQEAAADVEVSRSVDEDLKPNHQIDLEDEVEDEPLVRKSPVKVQPTMMDEGKNVPSISLATQDSSVSENLTPTYDSFFWDSLPEEPIPGLRPAIKEIEEEGPLQTSKPVVIPADVLEDIIPGYGGLQYKEPKEMGSWDCCLPFYTQRHIHIIEGQYHLIMNRSSSIPSRFDIVDCIEKTILLKFGFDLN